MVNAKPSPDKYNQSHYHFRFVPCNSFPVAHGAKQIFPFPNNAKGAPEVQQLRVSVTHHVPLKPWIFQLRKQSLKSKAYTSTALFSLDNPQTYLRGKVLWLICQSRLALNTDVQKPCSKCPVFTF